MKPVWAIVVLAALLAGPLTLAGGDAKPFLQIEKGNFWKYEGAENEEKISGKIEVTGIGEDGGLKIKFDGMGALWKEMTWRVTDDFLIWDLMPMTVEGWRVLKFSAGKGDSWTSRMGGMLEDAGIELKSKVVDIEDVRVPAGEFAGCLKVETTFGDDLGGGVQKFCMWWARDVGLVKVDAAGVAWAPVTMKLVSYKVGPDEGEQKAKEGAATIELRNGDKIEGEIIEESDSAVKIKTAYGLLSIPRSQISKITKSAPKPIEEPKAKKAGTAVIELKNGDKIEGEIVEETDAAVKIKTAYGPMTIPRSQIARISAGGAKPSAEILAKKKELADRHYELARWAREKGLEAETKLNLEAAIAVYPDHEKARAALGYVKKDGEWVKGEKTEEPEKPAQTEKKMSAEELLDAHQVAQQHLQAREYAKALEVYAKILKSYPDDLTANYNTACILSLDKKVEESLKYLEHSVRKARKAFDTGSWEEQQQGKSILDLLDTDTDLDNLRETDKFKQLMKIARGEKDKPAEDEKKEPKKPKKKQRDF